MLNVNSERLIQRKFLGSHEHFIEPKTKYFRKNICCDLNIRLTLTEDGNTTENVEVLWQLSSSKSNIVAFF